MENVRKAQNGKREGDTEWRDGREKWKRRTAREAYTTCLFLVFCLCCNSLLSQEKMWRLLVSTIWESSAFHIGDYRVIDYTVNTWSRIHKLVKFFMFDFGDACVLFTSHAWGGRGSEAELWGKEMIVPQNKSSILFSRT